MQWHSRKSLVLQCVRPDPATNQGLLTRKWTFQIHPHVGGGDTDPTPRPQHRQRTWAVSSAGSAPLAWGRTPRSQRRKLRLESEGLTQGHAQPANGEARAGPRGRGTTDAGNLEQPPGGPPPAPAWDPAPAQAPRGGGGRVTWSCCP